MLSSENRFVEAKENYSIAIRTAGMRDVYIAMNYFLLSVMRPIQDQGDERTLDLYLGLSLILGSELFYVVWEWIKYKKLLSYDLEIKIDRIVRHGINGVKDISILAVFLQVLAYELAPSTGDPEGFSAGIINLAEWLQQANPWIKLAIIGGLSGVKAASSFFLNRQEFKLTEQKQIENSTLIPRELNTRPFTIWNWVGLPLRSGLIFARSVVVAANELLIYESFGSNQVSRGFSLNYIFIKAGVQTALQLGLLDHPAYPFANLRRLGRFLQQYFIEAPQNTQFMFMAIFNLLSINSSSNSSDSSDELHVSDTESLSILITTYLLMLFPAEAFYWLKSAINDNDKQIAKKSLMANLIQKIGIAALPAAVLAAEYPVVLPIFIGWAGLSFLADENFNFRKNSKPYLIAKAPGRIIEAAGYSSLVVLSVENIAGMLGSLVDTAIFLPVTTGLVALSYFTKNKKLLAIIENSLKAAILGGSIIVSLNLLPENLRPPFSTVTKDTTQLGFTAIAAIGMGIWQILAERRRHVYEEINNEPSAKELSYPKLVLKGLLLLFSLICTFSIYENNNTNGDSLRGNITSILMLILLAASVTYSRYTNHGGKGFAALSERVSVCKPKLRSERGQNHEVEIVDEKYSLQ